MKTAIMTTLAVSALALTACTTQNTSAPSQPVKQVHGSPDAKGEMHRERGHAPVFYQCDGGAKVAAKYQPDSDRALIKVNAPNLSLQNQEIELQQATSGSGVRYVNDTNPASVYEWHVKGNDGVLTVTVNGTEYNYSCEATRPPMPANHPH